MMADGEYPICRRRRTDKMNIKEMSKERKELLVMLANIPENDLSKVKKVLTKPSNHMKKGFVIPQNVAEKYKKLKAESNSIIGKSDADDIKWCGYVEKLSTLNYQVPNIPANASDKEIYNTILKACIDNDMPINFCVKITSILLEYVKTGQSPPIILDGPPGCGKTESFKLICNIFDMALHFIPATAIRRGRGIYGEDKNYKSADIGNFVNGIIQTEVLNPVMLIDEIDKTVNVKDDIALEDELLPIFNNKERMVTDNFLSFPISFENSLFVFTCNDLSSLSEPFKDRCKIVRFEHTEEERMKRIINKYAKKEMATYTDSLELDETLLYNAIEELYHNDVFSIRQHQSLFDEARINAYTEFLESDEETPVIINKTHYDKAIAEITKGKCKASRIGF